jgi:uncharacterized membrane protein YedE/YeeE
MTRVRVASVLLGIGFGFLLSWAHFVDPDQIRRMLLFQEPYMWQMFATAVAIGFVAIRLMRRAHVRSLLTREPVSWSVARPERRHLVGAAIFGLGWAVSDACPGPLVALIGQGVIWVLPLFVGVALGVVLFTRREEAPVRSRKRGRVPGIATPLPASNPE